MPNEQEAITTGGTGLLDLLDLSLLWRRKVSLLLSVIVAAGLAAAYATQETPIYEVSARVLIQRERFATEQERLVRTDPSFLATQGEILRSPVVVQPALESLRSAPAAEPDFAATNQAMRRLRVSSVDDANVLKLAYRSEDPDYAVRLLHAIVDRYRLYSKEMQHGGFAEAVQVLAERDAELRAELERLEEEYYRLRKDSPLIGQGKEAFSAHLAMLEQIGRRLTEARSRRIDKETQMQALLLADGGRESADRPVVHKVGEGTPDKDGADMSLQPQLEATTFVHLRAIDGGGFNEDAQLTDILTDPLRIQMELWKAELWLTEVSQTFGPKHPEARAAEAQISAWRQRLDDYQEAAPAMLSQQLAALEKNETHLQDAYDMEFQKVKLLDSSMLKEQHALAEIQRVQEIHDVTAKQLRELKFADEALANGQITTIVRILEAPDATPTLVWPRPIQFISLCAALGFVAGCVLVTLTERLTRRS